jgi:hypothetical protein
MKPLKILILLAIVAGTPSCASIVSRTSYPVDFNSTPQGAGLTIENSYGQVVFSGRTPTTVWLSPAAGYMRAEHYKVTYTQPGREPVTTWIHAQLNGWYFGNLLLGGFIGMLLVDPLTGAMFRIPPQSYVTSVAVEPPLLAPEAPAAPATAPGEAQTPAPAPAGGWLPLGE